MTGEYSDWDPTKLTINQMPAPREAYWIGVFDDAVEPEFTGYHPGVIIGTSGNFDEKTGTVTFVPLTSEPPKVGTSGKIPVSKYQLMKNPHPTDGRTVWAVCDHILTVRLSRLERYKEYHRKVVPKVSKQDFSNILSSIVSGHVALRNHIEAGMRAERDRLIATHEDTICALKSEFDRSILERAYSLLDEMTDPEKV
ncbi:type II toxin-antitoxin system PemK/MazF family toxin [Rhizobium sp. GCM10022189]|uniref:type II toxin-antitoxin system PemK/MazF family toxin n=1 Tax=Rhizobium sp. GCM10022189 TaxID=3252654 RepID=UPI00360A7E25